MFIGEIEGAEVLDSRKNTTIKATVILEDEFTFGSAIVSSGASRGEKEAVEVRDTDLTSLSK